MADRAERPYDIVLFGATGFVGGLTAEYLAEHAGEQARWALAGRSRAGLEQIRSRLAAAWPHLGELPLLIVDAADTGAVRAMAESARVLITTVGPYIKHGEPVVAACAAAGTDYVDITGEAEFVDLMWLRYHSQAEESGARLVHSCGFDSIPYDLGALWTASQLGDDTPIALQGFGRISGGPSGGSFHSAVHIMARLRQAAAVARQRRAREGTEASGGRRVREVAARPHRSKLAEGWVVPAPTIDPQLILRSARVLDTYGPDFSYAHHMVLGSLAKTTGVVAGIGALAGLAQLAPTRNLLLRLRDPGQGPSADQRARASFRVRMVADAAGRQLITDVSGGDPACGETSKMLAESALCLAFDTLPPTRGQVTPAVAMGQVLIERLSAAGIGFRVVSESSS